MLNTEKIFQEVSYVWKSIKFSESSNVLGVSHRPSTMCIANRVLSMDGGRVS